MQLRRAGSLLATSVLLALTLAGPYAGILQTPSVSAAAVAPFTLAKTANPIVLSSGGGPVTYTYTVTYPVGAVATPYALVVTDDKCPAADIMYVSGDTNGSGKIDPGETWVFTCTYDVTAIGSTTNTALVTGTPAVGPVMVSNTSQATVDVLAITLVKTANPVSLPGGGGPVTYTYTVTNPGDKPLKPVTIFDNKCAPISAPTGDTNADGFLDPGEIWTFTCTTNIGVTTTNVATVTGTFRANTATATDSTTVRVAQQSALIAIKKAAFPSNLPLGGGMVTYTYTVTNPGSVPLGGVTVTDNKCSPVAYSSGDANLNNKLDLAETWIYTCTTSITATTVNTAVATGFDPSGVGTTATATATVTVAGCPPTNPQCTPPPTPCPPTNLPNCTNPPCPPNLPMCTFPPCPGTSPNCTPFPCPITSPNCTPPPTCPTSSPMCTFPPCPGTSPNCTPFPCAITSPNCTAPPCPPNDPACTPPPTRSPRPTPTGTVLGSGNGFTLPPTDASNGLGASQVSQRFNMVLSLLLIVAGFATLFGLAYPYVGRRRRRKS